jgi:hypothetical protein
MKLKKYDSNAKAIHIAKSHKKPTARPKLVKEYVFCHRFFADPKN